MEPTNSQQSQPQMPLQQGVVHIARKPYALLFGLVSVLLLGIGLLGGYLYATMNRPPIIQNTQQPVQISPTVSIENPTRTTVPSTSVVKTSPTVSQVNGASLANIKYTLSTGWKGEINGKNLLLSQTGGGYLSISVYEYDGRTGRREYYCQVSKMCIEGVTKYMPVTIGNISGYMASGLDNSGGGNEYFGVKGNKFYIISSYNPPSANEFEKSYQAVLDSLVF